MAKQKAQTQDNESNHDTFGKGNSLEVVTRWQYTAEASAAFKRLLALLLKERSENGEKTTERESTRRDYQVL